jgi:hypothetical protein
MNSAHDGRYLESLKIEIERLNWILEDSFFESERRTKRRSTLEVFVPLKIMLQK